MGAGHSQISEANVEADADFDQSILAEFKLDMRGEWITYKIVIKQGEPDSFCLLEWYHLDEPGSDQEDNNHDNHNAEDKDLDSVDSRILKRGVMLNDLRLSIPERLSTGDEVLECTEFPGIQFKRLESLQGTILFRSVFKGESEQTSRLIVVNKASKEVVLSAKLTYSCPITRSVHARKQKRTSTGPRYSYLPYALTGSTSGQETTTDDEETEAEDEDDTEKQLRKLIRRAHSSTVYGIFDRESLEETFLTCKRTAKAPISYILSDESTALALRIYHNPTLKIRANILLMGFDSMFLDPFGRVMADEYPVAVYVCDPLGFGYSAGKRGHARTTHSLLADVRAFVRLIRNNSDLPVYLAGILFTGGLMLNYCSWLDAEPVDGLLVLGSAMGYWKNDQPSLFNMDRLVALEKQKVYKDNTNKSEVDSGAVKSNGKNSEDWKKNLGLPMTSEAFEVNPMVVEEISVTAIQSCLNSDPPRAFRSLRIPHKLFFGEKDEIFQVELLAEQFRREEPEAVEIFVGATHLGMLRRQDVRKSIWKFIEAKLPAESAQDRNAPTKSLSGPCDSFRFFNSTGKVTERLTFEYSRKQKICVDVLQSVEKPQANLVILLPKCWRGALETMATRHPFRIICITPQGFFEGSGRNKSDCFSVYAQIEAALKQIKMNAPGLPIFLSGYGFGASLALNFADWAENCPINGFILLAPIPDPLKNQKLVTGNLKQRLAKPKKRLSQSILGWVMCRSRSSTEAKSVSVSESTASRSSLSSSKHYNMESFRVEAGIEAEEENLVRSVMVSNLKISVDTLGAPFLLLLSEQDPDIRTETVMEKLKPFSKPPFQKIQAVPGSVPETLCKLAIPLMAEWILQTASTSFDQLELPAFLTIQSFEPIGMIGQGSYGSVWLAKHKETNRHVAIKILEKSHICKPSLIRQAVRELKILAKLRTPFVPKFFGAFQDPGRLYFVMEYVVGGELLRRLQDLGRMTNEDARFYAAEILVALEYLHSNRIAYRDLKPENVLLDTLGHVRLIDFGYARMVGDDGRCGSFCGSPYYIAPELLRKGFYDGRRADIWSLGTLIYEMLTGKPPFLGRSMRSVYARILMDDPVIPSHMEPDAADLLGQMLAKDPKKRMGSLEQVKHHRWFKNIDWDRVAGRLMVPPYLPTYLGDNDITNYYNFEVTLASFYRPDKDPTTCLLRSAYE